MRQLRNALTMSALLAICACSANGQRLRLGLKSGINVSRLDLRVNEVGEGLENIWKPVLVSQFGGFVEKPLSDKFSIQTELLFSVRGSNIRLVEPLKYSFSVPLLLNCQPWKRVTLEVGPNAVFVQQKSFPAISNVRFTLLGGCRFTINPAISLGVRYIDGLHPLTRSVIGLDARGNPKTVGSSYIKNVQVMVAYHLPSF